MTTIRRIAVLLLLTTGAIAGASLPAWAAFKDSVTVPTTVSTIQVTAPSSVTVNGSCSTTSSSSWNGWGWGTSYSYWYSATVTWPASTTPRGVTGYRVMAHLNDGSSFVMAETNAATRSTSATVDRSNLNYQPRLSVVTLTSYGWTAESAKTGVLTC